MLQVQILKTFPGEIPGYSGRFEFHDCGLQEVFLVLEQQAFILTVGTNR